MKLSKDRKAELQERLGKAKLSAYERPHCKVCQEPLEHKETGRPAEFCSGRCRVKYHRAVKKWARACVDAMLAGKIEPAHPYPFNGGAA